MTAGSEAQARVQRRFGPTPLSVLPLVLFAVGSLALAGSSPWLAWLPLLPLTGVVWVLRARVVVADDGLLVSNGLGRTRVAWPSVEGFDVPRRGPVRLLHDGRRTALTALPRHELRRLLRAVDAVGGPQPPS